MCVVDQRIAEDDAARVTDPRHKGIRGIRAAAEIHAEHTTHARPGALRQAKDAVTQPLVRDGGEFLKSGMMSTGARLARTIVKSR